MVAAAHCRQLQGGRVRMVGPGSANACRTCCGSAKSIWNLCGRPNSSKTSSREATIFFEKPRPRTPAGRSPRRSTERRCTRRHGTAATPVVRQVAQVRDEVGELQPPEVRLQGFPKRRLHPGEYDTLLELPTRPQDGQRAKQGLVVLMGQRGGRIEDVRAGALPRADRVAHSTPAGSRAGS